jgi:hypothetical protein
MIEVTDFSGEGNIIVKVLECPRPFRAAFSDRQGLVHVLPSRTAEWGAKHWLSIKLHVPEMQFLGAIEEQQAMRGRSGPATILPFRPPGEIEQ